LKTLPYPDTLLFLAGYYTCLSVLFPAFGGTGVANSCISWPPYLPQAKKSVYIGAIRGLPFVFIRGPLCVFVATLFAAGKKKACPLEADFL